MESEDKIYAEKVLKHLFLGAQVDGMQFGVAPGITKIYFTHFENTDDFEGQLYLNIESKWYLYNNRPDKYPSNEEEIEDYSEDEEYSRIYNIRRQKVIDIKLDKETPHLFITLENGYTFFVNGFHNKYECWQAGVQYDHETWLVVAVPGNEVATWAPKRFIN